MEKSLNQGRPPTGATAFTPCAVGLWSAMLLHFALFLMAGLSRHWGYMSSLNDLGIFDQVAWNTLQGNFFQTTTNPFSQSLNWLGFHFHPVLLFFVPLYAISPSAEWFVVAQAASLSLTAWPIFLLANHVFRHEKTALLWAIVYLTNPFQLSAGAWDFHPVSLAVPFLALALLAVVKKNTKLLFFSCLLILACQEHLGLTVAGLGALWWLRHRTWRPALALIMLGTLHLILVLGVIMPYFSPVSAHVMLGEHLGYLSRYNWLGTSLTEVVRTLATDPLLVWKKMVSMGGVSYWLLLLIPFGFRFPLLGVEFLLAGLADLAANTLSANPMPRGIYAYHSVSLIPALTVAAIFGVVRLSNWMNNSPIGGLMPLLLTGLVLATSSVSGYHLLPAPLKTDTFWAPTHFTLQPDPALRAVRRAIGPDSALSAQANVGAHFSQRQEIYLYPHHADETDAIVLWLASPTTNINNFPLPINLRKHKPNWLDSHLQMDRTEYLASITCLVSGGKYGVKFWNDPWLVLARHTKNHTPEVEDKVRQLPHEWQISDEEYQDEVKKCLSHKDIEAH